MTTMSPGVTRRNSRSMSRSTRAVPVIPGRELAVRDSSADIFMWPILSSNGSWAREARRNIGPRSHICHNPFQGWYALQILNTQPNRERDLVAATARQWVELILTHLAEVLGDSPLSACVPALVHAAETDPAVRGSSTTRTRHGGRRLAETLAAGVQAGELPARIDADAASVALAGAMFYRRLMTADAPDAEFIRRLVDTVLGR
jgi:hypothetical protein